MSAGLVNGRGRCWSFLSAAVVKHSYQKQLCGGKDLCGLCSQVTVHLGKPGQELKQEPAAETMKECCLLACLLSGSLIG